MSDHEEMGLIHALQALSPLDGRYLNDTKELQRYFSEYALIRTRVEIEIRYFQFLSRQEIAPPIEQIHHQQLENLLTGFSLDDVLRVKAIETHTNHDVKAVEYFLREKFETFGLGVSVTWLHFGLTSDDVNNLAYRILLKRCDEQVLWPLLFSLHNDLKALSLATMAAPMLARTHGQAAIPTTFGKEMAVFASRLKTSLDEGTGRIFYAKFSGAVGNWSALQFSIPDKNWPDLTEAFIQSFEMEQASLATQIAPPEDLVGLFHNLLRINGVLLDLAQDLWRYISDGWLALAANSNQVGSSTMPQKINPIDFENSEGNLVIANGLLEALSRKLPVSRLQRDLSESTVMRNIGVSLGHCLLAYKSLRKGLAKILVDPGAMLAALNANWNILAEALQTVARLEGRKDAYEAVAAQVKNRQLDTDGWIELVESLGLSEQATERLKHLTPETYLGLAVAQTRDKV